jgi:type II secretory pathway pseudopilin PulG
MKGKYKNYSFTLTETLVTVAVFLIIIVTIYSAYVLSQKSYREREMSAEIAQNGRVILERMVREIRQAKEIVTELPQDPDNPNEPPSAEIEFEDGHIPLSCQELGSDHYYIRYYIYTPADSQEPKELRRQYRVYCFDACDTCNTYWRWDDTRIVEGITEPTHPCNLRKDCTLGEDVDTIGEYITDLKFWGKSLIDISITLSDKNKEIKLQTEVFGRNL